MFPTPEQIRDAAYDHWRRRGGGHGHDRDDWLRAEQELLFALNYAVLTRIGPETPPASASNGSAAGDQRRRRVCRFCEQSAPQTRFAPAVGNDASPSFHGDATLSIPDECEECRRHFDEHVATDLARFLQTFRDGWAPGEPPPASLASAPYVPIAALKGLTRMALACLPRPMLETFEDAIEWVGNPDHALDSRASGPLTCDLHLFESPFPGPQATLSLRRDEREAMPYALFHFGHERALYQITVPFCGHDDELDGETVAVPGAVPSIITGRTDLPTASATISLASSRPTCATRIDWR